jgi:hypothetical protein
MVLAVLMTTTMFLQRNIAATRHYTRAANDAQRLIDYVAQDLRRAVRVGVHSSGAYSTLKSNVSMVVTQSDILTITIPDYYASNSGSVADDGFARSRYSRAILNLLPLFNGGASAEQDGTVPWSEAVTRSGSVETVRFAPSQTGNGEVQVRYYCAPRSGALLFYRAEHKPGSATPNYEPQEIAEPAAEDGKPLVLSVSTTDLPNSHSRHGRIFQITASFSPRYARVEPTTSVFQQRLTVLLRNPRRD